MKPSHIEHIGIAVNSLEEAIPFYENVLGLECYNIEEVADQMVKTAFFILGQTKIELLEATSPDSAIAKFISKRGPGLHHIALAVEDVNSGLAHMQSQGIRLIDEKPREGAEGLDIGFIHPGSSFGVLMELCGEKKT